MKILELKEFTPADSDKWMVTAYPGPGAYVSSDGAIAVVHTMPGTTSPIVTRIESASYMLKDVTTPEPAANAVRSLSEEFVLKALAIAQSPELAKELVK